MTWQCHKQLDILLPSLHTYNKNRGAFKHKFPTKIRWMLHGLHELSPEKRFYLNSDAYSSYSVQLQSVTRWRINLFTGITDQTQFHLYMLRWCYMGWFAMTIFSTPQLCNTVATFCCNVVWNGWDCIPTLQCCVVLKIIITNCSV